MRKRGLLRFLVLLIAVLGLAAVGCGGSDDDGGGDGGSAGGGGGAAEPLPSASCGPVSYEGDGEAEYLIASDFPLQGANRSLTTEMADAVNFVLKQRDYKVGDLNIGFQSCDDSTAQAGSWDSAKCTSNARAYAANEKMLGLVGTFNSGCAKLVIPILNRATNGPVAMVSPSNTNPGLTEAGPGADPGAPDIYYPNTTRNYARVVWNDQHQGAANALYAKELGLKKVYVLNDSETYGLGIANLFVRYAEKQDIQILGNQKWDKKASSYESIASRIKASGADGVFLGGIVCNNGGKLIKDLRAGLGPDVTILGPDGWTPISATIEGAGPAANTMYISQPGVPEDQLTGAGADFVTSFKEESGKDAVDPYTAYAAQATEVLLEAIERAGSADRAKISEELFNTDVKDGILGDFQIDENGDTTLGTVTFFQVKNGEPVFVKTITPELAFVES
ncbi:MAG: branched-chain amino acid ABC transporter substrate-binding protein [Actinobacteria bacterium]|nr:branched-chain amino acid ABC transporter substrate-binding protein [Actinomycetota bacterium]MBA3739004.1 branched-chain amino acid ABC transporter substrate-binding protein [Actinomycetota bacterium]